jgi:hypothetical protein
MKKGSNEDKTLKVLLCFVPCFTKKKNYALKAHIGAVAANNVVICRLKMESWRLTLEPRRVSRAYRVNP